MALLLVRRMPSQDRSPSSQSRPNGNSRLKWPVLPSRPAMAVLYNQSNSNGDKFRMKQLTPLAAHTLLQQQNDAVLVDVRSEMEFLFVGHPVGAINIPWNDGPDWEVNPHFVAQIRRVVSEHRAIVLICRSGSRSGEAGKLLEAAGFLDVYNVEQGFEGDLDESHQRGNLGGWRHDGLPWEQI